MFDITERVNNPQVVIPKEHKEKVYYERTARKGPLYKVFPHTAKEVFALQMLEHRVEKFAPADGNGIYITPQALAKFSQ